MNKVNSKSNELSLKKVIISLIMTIVIWSIITNAWGYTNIFFNAQANSIITYTYNFVCRLLWSSFVIALLYKYADSVPTKFKELFTNKPNMKPLIISIVIITLYNVGGMIYNHGGLWINPDFDLINHFIMFAMVAFAEEIVYRGWGLNALSKFMTEKKANLVSTIFFIMIHLPAYFIRLYLVGTFPVAAVVTQCTFALILGLLFGYLYNKGKSLWSPMILHFLADFLAVMMIG